MSFAYKRSRSQKLTGPILPKIAAVPEVLAGVIDGTKMPQDEERWYRATWKTGKVLEYHIQLKIGMMGAPGYKTLDALVNTTSGWRAFEVDGAAFVHRNQSKKEEDRLSDFVRMDGLKRMGIQPRLGIEHISDVWLQNQDDADRKAQATL